MEKLFKEIGDIFAASPLCGIFIVLLFLILVSIIDRLNRR